MKDFVTNIVLSLQAAANLETGGGHVGDGAAVVVVAHLLAVLLVAGAVADAHVGGGGGRRTRQPAAAAAESHAATAGGWRKMRTGTRATSLGNHCTLPLKSSGLTDTFISSLEE